MLSSYNLTKHMSITFVDKNANESTDKWCSKKHFFLVIRSQFIYLVGQVKYKYLILISFYRTNVQFYINFDGRHRCIKSDEVEFFYELVTREVAVFRPNVFSNFCNCYSRDATPKKKVRTHASSNISDTS